MTGVFIPYETIKNNEFLRNIWDCALDYLCSHSQELEKFIDDSQQYRISRGILQALIDEMDYTYEKAEYFDTSNYSKDNPEIKTSFQFYLITKNIMPIKRNLTNSPRQKKLLKLEELDELEDLALWLHKNNRKGLPYRNCLKGFK